MPHTHRFFVEPAAIKAATAFIDGPEAHHAIHVVRVRPDDEVVLFDGAGRELIGRVAEVSRRDVRVAVLEDRRAPRETRTLTLVQASLHRDKAVEELIRRCTEVGVSRFVFYPAGHSERPPKPSDKWRRWAIDSCKQCGRLLLPDIATAPDLETAATGDWLTLLVATKGRDPAPLREAASGNALALAVGPEGDFTRDELDLLLEKGGKPISLGASTFRSEVAAALAAALIRYEMGLLGP